MKRIILVVIVFGHLFVFQDEIAELQTQLSALQSKVPNAMSSQKEVTALRAQIQIKENSIHNLQTKEQDLIRECDRMKVYLRQIR